MSIFKYGLLDTVEDRITGYKGVITARTEWSNGCIRYTVQAHGTKDGKTIEPVYVGEQDVILQKANKPVTVSDERRGGPPTRGRDMRSPVGR